MRADREEESPRQLGLGAVAGDQIWDHSSKARIRIGPLVARAVSWIFCRGPPTHGALRALARFYSGGQIDFDVQLVLARDRGSRIRDWAARRRASFRWGCVRGRRPASSSMIRTMQLFSLGEESWA